VRFIQDVNLESIARGTIASRLAQFANFINAPVRGGVDFDHVHLIARSDFGTGVTNAARFKNRLVRRAAVQGHGQDSRNRSFPNTTMPAEDVTVSGAALLDRILQSASDVLLPDNFRELLRTVFSGKDLVAHGKEIV
jgi:hypothetical protein